MEEKEVFISDAIIYESFQLGKLNLIEAPCGSGKSTAALETIPKYLNIKPNRCLILVNSRAAAESFVASGLAINDYYGNEKYMDSFHSIKKPTVMTYAYFGAHYKKNDFSLDFYDYIVCDEIHTLNTYIAMARSKLYKQYPNALPWEVNDMLQVTCSNYIAIETIEAAIKNKTIWVFALTATPRQLFKSDLNKLGVLVNEVKFSQKLHAYDIFCKFEYAEIEPILRAIIPENRKRLFYFHTIKELKKYKQILLDCGRAAEAIWSIENNEKMDAHELTTRDYVIQEHRFPEDVQDLLINSAYDTSLTIKDELVKEAYMHTSSEDVRRQGVGRLRQDLEIVGYYNKDLKRNRRKQEAEGLLCDAIALNIPECFIGIKLYSEDKENLIKAISFPKKWPSLKKSLLNNGYKITDKSNGNKRYSIIERQT